MRRSTSLSTEAQGGDFHTPQQSRESKRKLAVTATGGGSGSRQHEIRKQEQHIVYNGSSHETTAEFEASEYYCAFHVG